MDTLGQIVARITSEAEQSPNQSIVSQARDLKEPSTIEEFKSDLLQDYLKLMNVCLQNKNSKLRSLALNGYEAIIRDNLLWRPDVCENHFFNQIITNIKEVIPNCNEISQVELLKCLLEVTCSRISHLRSTDLESVAEICCSIIASTPPPGPSSLSAPADGPLSPKVTAATATAIQSYRYFMEYLISESQVELRDALNHQIIPILDTLCQKVLTLRKKAHQLGNDKSSRSLVNQISWQISFYLKCVQSVLTPLELDSQIEKDLSDFVWQKLGPMLIKLLSSNMNRIKSPRPTGAEGQTKDETVYGRGSQCLSIHDRNMIQMREVYSVARELVRLFGQIKSMRPVLESLFHRMLLYPLIHFRLEALQTVKELFKDPGGVVKLCTTIASSNGLSCTNQDMNLMKIIIDSLLECSSTNDQEIVFQSGYCIISLIETLELIAFGKGFNSQRFTSVSDSNCDDEGKQLEDGDGDPSMERCPLKSEYDSNEDDDDYDGDIVDGSNGSNFVGQANEEKIEATMDTIKDDLDIELSVYKSRLMKIMKSSQDDEDEEPEAINNNQGPANDEDASRSDEIFVTDEGASGESLSSSNSQYGLEETDQDPEAVRGLGDDGGDHDDDEALPHNQDDVKFEEDGKLDQFRSRIIMEVRGENERNQVILNNHDSLTYQERKNARDIVQELKKLLPDLLNMKSSVQIDDALQRFASDFCKRIWEKRKLSSLDILIINGDGIYLAVYSALLLNLKLIKSNYYDHSKHSKPPITEQEFIDDIYNSGVLVYLSSTWLAELYQQILTNNLLEDAAYSYSFSNNVALINMIRDIADVDPSLPGCHELSDYRKLIQTGSQFNQPKNANQKLAQEIAKRILETFWDPMIRILESIFKVDSNSSSLISPFALLLNYVDSEKENLEKRAIIISCLSSLQIASRLCISLGLQSRCHGVFNLLTRAIIINPDKSMDNYFKRGTRIFSQSNSTSVSLHASQILSLRSMLINGLEIATHCKPCWEYIFQSCAFISELETIYYNSKAKKPLKNRLTSLLRSKKHSNSSATSDFTFDTTQLETSSPLLGFESESDLSIYLDQCIEAALNEKNGKKGDGILQDGLLERSLECLSHLSDRLFNEATSRLNLQSLLAFLETLISTSSHQMNQLSRKEIKSTSILLFSRFCEVLLRIGKSGRPLVHFMRCWGLAVPHLIEASCSSMFEQSICKLAVSATNDVISTVLAIHNELDYFHFNEALFMPYEKILLLELCDTDIQEMIVSSICGFVEGSREDIKSGWRSLFAALRGVELPEQLLPCSVSKPGTQSSEPNELEMERVRQLRVILDIFEAFLSTKNLDIFANAALDCLLCLLGLMKDPTDGKDHPNAAENPDYYGLEKVDTDAVDLCLLSLKYLHQFESLLRSLYHMPACPFFISSRRITISEEPKIIEVPKNWSDEKLFNLQVDIKLSEFDKPSRILNVWFALIDGLFDCIIRCPKQRQAKTIETCMAILGTLRNNPGNQFAIYCINHAALPFLQKWCHQINNQPNSSISSAALTNFKHFLGLVSHLVVQHIKVWHEDKSLLGSDLMLSQTVITLIEATDCSYREAISNLSLSCFSHVIMESYCYYDEAKWNIISSAFKLMHRTSLTSLVKLIDAFPNRTLDFYQDLEKIRVVARRVPTMPKAELITKGLAREIFLLDCQKVQEPEEGVSSTFSETEKYFIFEIITDENNHFEIPFRDLIRELMKHQSIIKLMGSIILDGKPYNLSPYSFFIEFKENPDKESCFPAISPQFIDQTVELLMESYLNFHEFDTRLGLKLVMQKMARLHVPANLYKQAALSVGISILECFNSFVSDEEDSIARAGSNLEKIFGKLCHHYTDFIVQSQPETGKLDELMANPIFLFPESSTLSPSFESSHEKTEGPGSSGSITGLTDTNIQSDQQANSQEGLADEKELRNYIVMSKNRIDSVMKDYRKWKCQHSPIPPSFNETRSRKSQLPKHFRTPVTSESDSNDIGNYEGDNDNLVRDTEAYVTLFSQFFISLLQCVLSLNDFHFSKIIPYLNEGIETLIVYTQSKDLRTILALLYRRCAQNR